LTVVEPVLFEWDVFEMAAPIQSPAKCEVRSVIRKKRMGSALKFLRYYTHWKEISFLAPLWLEMKHGFYHTPESSTTMMRWKKKSWRGSKGWWQTSMTRGYRSWFQDLINVWKMPSNMLKN